MPSDIRFGKARPDSILKSPTYVQHPATIWSHAEIMQHRAISTACAVERRMWAFIIRANEAIGIHWHYEYKIQIATDIGDLVQLYTGYRLLLKHALFKLDQINGCPVRLAAYHPLRSRP